jgi:2-polyprenyl-3-methyl-5-hydroxy-6-metoxy-1,4-benzoquinol methylase
MTSRLDKIQLKDGSAELKVIPAPNCCLCRRPGALLYKHLEDRLFSAPGKWNIRSCPNPDCGLLWIDPKPVEADLGKLYKQYYTHSDADRNSLPRRLFASIRNGYLHRLCGYRDGAIGRLSHFSSYALELYPPKRSDFEFPMGYLRGRAKGKLLDLGCGAGLSLEVAHNSGWLAEGIDVDSAALANVRSKGLRARTGALPELGLPSASYEVVAMNHVIEHLYDPLKILIECARILQPGGLLLINTPNTGSLGHRWFKQAWVALDPPRHLHLFSARSLRALVGAAGFTITTLEAATGRAAGVLTASRSIRRTGRFDMRQAPSTYGRVGEMIEWAVNLLREAGEELRVVGQKPLA